MSNYRNNNNRDIEFKVSAQLGVISKYATGWAKELNIISWNGGAAKFDIRDWDPSHEHMSRGITLHEDEARALMELLEDRFGAQPRRGRRVKGEWPDEEIADAKMSETTAAEVGVDSEAAVDFQEVSEDNDE